MVFSFKENRVRRAYLGGAQIDKFVGNEVAQNGNRPEDWLASVVIAFNPDYEPIPNEGLSILENGEVFKSIIDKNPEAVFGKRLANKYGGKSSILVKLLDSAERLVIQCHPTVDFAMEHFASPFGKTECWYFLDTTPEASVYLGFKEGITKEKWVSLFEKQDVEGMLNSLHRFPVKKGDLWFVDGGVPHAIGEGCFMIELQEPSDLMVIPERVTPSGRTLSDSKLHGGLGWDKMFDCFIYKGLSEEETKKLYYRKSVFESNKLSAVVDDSLTNKFSLSNLRVSGEATLNLGDIYSVCVVTSGECVLKCEGEELNFKKGQSFFIGADSGELEFEGNAEIVMCSAV